MDRQVEGRFERVERSMARRTESLGPHVRRKFDKYALFQISDRSEQDDGVFVMEYSDFLSHWEGIERTQLFDNTWVQSSHWLDVKSRPLPSAWQFGDVSCAFLRFHRLLWMLIVQKSHSTSRNGLKRSLYYRNRTPATIKAFRVQHCGLLISNYSSWDRTRSWGAPPIRTERRVA